MDLAQIAQTTSGFTGADLENLLNEAAILAAKENRVYIQQSDIRHAFVKVGIGAEKKSKVVSGKEKKITAYHEAGACDFISCASGCGTCLQRVYHSYRSGCCRIYDAASGK